MSKTPSRWLYALPFVLILAAAMIMLRPPSQELQPSQAPQSSQESESTPLPEPAVDLAKLDTRMEERWDFTLPDVNGKTVSLADFEGKVVLLNFFGTWCPPCAQEMPSFEQVFQRNKDKGLVVLAIANDPSGAKAVAPFIEKYKLTFPIVLNPDGKVFQTYMVRNLPVTYLLDKQGHIAGMHRGAADWNSAHAQSLIDHLLGS